MRIALTIAGSDSGGGAGIQADLKTFHQFGVFGTSVITAVTAQNTLGVTQWEAVSPDLVAAQIHAVATDLTPAATKSGMLANRAVVAIVAEAIAVHRLVNYVLDPVMVASSGDVLLQPDAVSAVRDRLLPLAVLVTPNLHEAGLLLEAEVTTEDDMVAAGQRLIRDYGARAVLVKGSHLEGGEVIDILIQNSEARRISHPRIITRSTHGTGCTLSSAITALLARGIELSAAVDQAIDFVHRAIASASRLGAGHGPLNHFVLPVDI